MASRSARGGDYAINDGRGREEEWEHAESLMQLGSLGRLWLPAPFLPTFIP
jgi:hypothetical protein